MYLAQLHWLYDKCLCYHGYIALAAIKQWMRLEVEVDTKLVRNRQTQQINNIGHELQGVLCKVRTTCFALPRPSSGPKS